MHVCLPEVTHPPPLYLTLPQQLLSLVILAHCCIPDSVYFAKNISPKGSCIFPLSKMSHSYSTGLE